MPTRVEAPEVFAAVASALAAAADGEVVRVVIQDQPGLEKTYPGVASFALDEAATSSVLIVAPTAPRTLVPGNYSVSVVPTP